MNGASVLQDEDDSDIETTFKVRSHDPNDFEPSFIPNGRTDPNAPEEQPLLSDEGEA